MAHDWQTRRGDDLWNWATNAQSCMILWSYHSYHSCTKVFHWWIFSHLRIVPLTLHRVTIRLPLSVREKEPPILTFLNLYVNISKPLWDLMKFMLAFDSWTLNHYIRLVNFLFSYLLYFDSLEKKSFSDTVFF